MEKEAVVADNTVLSNFALIERAYFVLALEQREESYTNIVTSILLPVNFIMMIQIKKSIAFNFFSMLSVTVFIHAQLLLLY